MDTRLSGRENQQVNAAGTNDKQRRPPLSVRASWTDSPRRGPLSAYAELERQRYGLPSEDEGAPKYLTWADRQRLMDRPTSPLWPMLVAIGMLCIVSLSLSQSNDLDADIRQMLQERIEMPFVPHEWEAKRERGDFAKVQEKAGDADADAESGDLLLQRKKDEFFMEEGDKKLDWVEQHITLGSFLLTGADLAVLLTQAPENLRAILRSIMKQAKELEALSKGSSKLSILFHQDLLSVAQLILLCRVLSMTGNLDRTQRERLHALKKLVKKRFGEEWPEALSMTRYMGGRKEHEVYGRLAHVLVCSVDSFFNQFIKGGDKADVEGESGKKKHRKGGRGDRCPWKITTNRFELQRLLEEAKLSPHLAEAFRTESD